MEIPKYYEIIIPALDLLTSHDSLKLREFELPLADAMGLSTEQIEHEYASGNGRIFYDRVAWALSYCNMAGLVTKPKRGVYKLSTIGRDLLNTPENVFPYIQKKLEERESNKKTNVNLSFTEPKTSELTPEESMYASFEGIKSSIYQEILDAILSKTPKEFEKLVVLLLQKMGYGGEVVNSGLVTQYSNDKGIDGIIKEDILGLGRIHIQAKRYAIDNSIGRDEIQKFVGALAVAQSNKGVFITTSYFTQGAKEYALNLNATTTLVLIDGMQLAKYMYDFNVGIQPEKVLEIKKLDNDFWDNMMDDSSVIPPD